MASRLLGGALDGLCAIGGSHAQRDVFEQVHIESLVRAGERTQAARLLEQRLARRGGVNAFALRRLTGVSNRPPGGSPPSPPLRRRSPSRIECREGRGVGAWLPYCRWVVVLAHLSYLQGASLAARWSPIPSLVMTKAMTHADPLQDLLDRVARRETVIGIIGLGYVGIPLALTALSAGFRVAGFDIDKARARS